MNRKKILAYFLDYPASHEVCGHHTGQTETELEKQISLDDNAMFADQVKLTEVDISTICNQRENSGTKSVAPEKAIALAPTSP